MPNRTAYPRSSARPIYVTAGVLGLLGLAGVIVMLVAMADVPRQSYYLLIAAFGLLIVALAGALAVLLATNTRRPHRNYSVPTNRDLPCVRPVAVRTAPASLPYGNHNPIHSPRLAQKRERSHP